MSKNTIIDEVKAEVKAKDRKTYTGMQVFWGVVKFVAFSFIGFLIGVTMQQHYSQSVSNEVETRVQAILKSQE